MPIICGYAIINQIPSHLYIIQLDLGIISGRESEGGDNFCVGSGPGVKETPIYAAESITLSKALLDIAGGLCLFRMKRERGKAAFDENIALGASVQSSPN